MAISRRELLTAVAAGLANIALPTIGRRTTNKMRRPNIIFILADDLGYGELGCYGQKIIKTPNLDRLASEGIRFTQYYSGSPVCAPSRCCLLTGLHTGHAYVRDNHEIGEWDSYQGQLPLPEGTVSTATLLQGAGYATACVGKWGLGRAGSSGDPNKQGFDLFFGYNCQRHAHNYYPAYLERNQEKVVLEGNDGKSATGKQYAPDLCLKEALGFIEANKGKPFFLHYTTTVPHAALQVPEDSLAEYATDLDSKPYDGKQGYLAHPRPHAAYAAMITRMDRDIGRLAAKIEELGLTKDTLIVFASDNGATFNGGVDREYFHSNGDLRGHKCQVFEGGIRVPMIARMPGTVKEGAVSALPCAAWDFLPTLCQLAGVRTPKGLDGISILPTLRGVSGQRRHNHLYWEYHSSGSMQAVRMGDWKGIRLQAKKSPNGAIQLYNLKLDPSEERDVAAEHPDVVREIEAIMARRKPAVLPEWNFGGA